MISSSSSWPSGTTVVASWTDANQNTVQYGMDSQGQLLGVVDALGHQTSFSYDSAHNLLSTTTPSGSVWQQQYDNRGNMLVSQDPLGQSTQLAYGVFDLPVSVTDPLGNKTLFSLDSSTGNVLQVTDANNNVSRFSYNGDGSVASATDPAGRTTQFGYDQWGHLTSRTDPLGNVTRYSYSVDSLLQQRVDALGYVTQYSYDGWGRLVSVSYPTSGAPGISYSWDAEGQLIQSSDSTGVRSYTYDVLGRKVKAVDPRGTTQASYDAVGNLLSQTDVTGRVLTNSYDAAYRLTSVVDGSDNAQVSLSYTADGQVSSVMYPNGVEVQYSYDAAGRVTSVQHVLVSSGTVLVGYSASYDAAGRLVQVVEQPSGDVTVYQYDAVGNLLKEQRSGSRSYSGSYTYDPSNLRLSAQVVVNGVPVHMGSYSYDGGGRLVQVVDSATNTTEVYSWNATGTLASAPGPGYTRGLMWNEEGQLVGIAHNGVLAYQYGYGADGNRRWRKDLANNVWVWYPCGVACSAGELVEEVSDLSGGVWSVQARYLRVGGGCSSQLVRRNGEYHHRDVLGNYGVITDGSGNVLSSNLYDRFGVSMYTSGSAQSPYRPAAGMLDEEGLLYQKRQRIEFMPNRNLVLAAGDPCANYCKVLGWLLGGYNTCMAICEAVEGILNILHPPRQNPPTAGGGNSSIPQPPTNCPHGTIPIAINCAKGSISTCVPQNFYQTCLPGCDADGTPDLCKTHLAPPPPSKSS
ncbi:RHS repeat protein [Chthonomonas calidirosea]|uniref:RHS repeat protein n=1 Tax=Chthonomonas calidirosea TaxID=454171 RepID=UPI00039DD286|nr:RHS repeat protein [Chthonomonas calidirosea]